MCVTKGCAKMDINDYAIIAAITTASPADGLEMLCAKIMPADEESMKMAEEFSGPGKMMWNSREDVQRFKEREKIFNQGLRKGHIEAARKFARELENNDNFAIGTFAIAFHVAHIDGSLSDNKIDTIVEMVGPPDSSLLSPYTRSENSKNLEAPLSFSDICTKYLNSLPHDKLEKIDMLIKNIMTADGTMNDNSIKFYNGTWIPYIRSRCYV